MVRFELMNSCIQFAFVVALPEQLVGRPIAALSALGLKDATAPKLNFALRAFLLGASIPMLSHGRVLIILHDV